MLICGLFLKKCCVSLGGEVLCVYERKKTLINRNVIGRMDYVFVCIQLLKWVKANWKRDHSNSCKFHLLLSLLNEKMLIA